VDSFDDSYIQMKNTTVYVQQYVCKVKQTVQFLIYNVRLFTKISKEYTPPPVLKGQTIYKLGLTLACAFV